MKISDTTLFYQCPSFYWKNLNPPFWENYENLAPPTLLYIGRGGGESSNNVGAVGFQKQVHDQNHITWLDKFYHATFHIWFSRAKIHDFTLWFWFKIISEAIIYTQQFFSAKTRVNKWVAMQHLAWISCFQLTNFNSRICNLLLYIFKCVPWVD